MSGRSDFNLRIMSEADLEMVRTWRNSEQVRQNMYTDQLISEDEHTQWFAQVAHDERSCPLLFEYQQRPVGFVSFSHIDATHGTAQWAFYLGETQVARGLGSTMEYLAIEYAFDTLHIRKLLCEVFVFNSTVIKMHKKFGFVEEGILVRQKAKIGSYEDVVLLALFQADWEREEERGLHLRKLCSLQ